MTMTKESIAKVLDAGQGADGLGENRSADPQRGPGAADQPEDEQHIDELAERPVRPIADHPTARLADPEKWDLFVVKGEGAGQGGDAVDDPGELTRV